MKASIERYLYTPNWIGLTRGKANADVIGLATLSSLTLETRLSMVSVCWSSKAAD